MDWLAGVSGKAGNGKAELGAVLRDGSEVFRFE